MTDTIKTMELVYADLLSPNQLMEGDLIKIDGDIVEVVSIEDDPTGDNYTITHRNEYGEGTTSGVLKLDGRPVFEYESHDDGYGFGGELSNIDHILEVMLDLLQREL